MLALIGVVIGCFGIGFLGIAISNNIPVANRILAVALGLGLVVLGGAIVPSQENGPEAIDYYRK